MPLQLHRDSVELAVGCGYKYLNGGPGAPAFLYVAEHLQERLLSPLRGWMGHAAPFDFAPGYVPAPRIDRFLAGTPPILSLAALECGIDTFHGELKSVTRTLDWARQQDLRTKHRQRQGATVGGAPFQYGSLRCVLSNRTYLGEVEHKGKVFPGRQQAIVPREIFEEAQRILSTLSSDEMCRPKLVSNSILQGIIVDRQGRRMGPVHTTRSGQRFHYYVTHPKTLKRDGPAAYRLSADELERRCCELLAEHLASQATSVDGKAEASSLAATLTGGPNEERRKTIVANIRAIIIGDAELTMELVTGETLVRGLVRVRHGNDAALIVGPTLHPQEPKADPQLAILLRDAQRAQALALAKPKLSLEQLAAKFGRSPERYKRLLRLSYLSPMIVATVLEGTQPARLTNRFLQNLDGLPLSWSEQEELLLA